MSKLKWTSFAIRSVKSVLSQGTLRMIYFSYIDSIITCSIIVWGNATYSTFGIKKKLLESTSSRSRASCRDLFKKMNILPLCSQYIHKKSAPLYRHWSSAQAIRPIQGVEVELCSFLTMALERGEGSASHRGSSLLLEKTRYPLYRSLGGPQDQSGQQYIYIMSLYIGNNIHLYTTNMEIRNFSTRYNTTLHPTISNLMWFPKGAYCGIIIFIYLPANKMFNEWFRTFL